MADNTNQPDVHRQLEDRLASYRERIDFPRMGDSAATARARIESDARPPGAVTQSPASPFDDWDDDPVETRPTAAARHRDDAPPTRLRQILTVAAAVLAFVIVGAALVVALPALTGGDDGSPAVLGPETTGYELARIIGGSLIPNEPVSVAVDSEGNIYAADFATRNIHKFNASGDFLESYTATGADAGEFVRPWDLAIDEDDSLYVLDQGNASVYRFDTSGTVVASWFAGAGNDEPAILSGIALDADGYVYVTDANAESILIFDQVGGRAGELRVADDSSSGDDRPVDVAIGVNGEIYVTSFSGRSIRVFTESGEQTAELDFETIFDEDRRFFRVVAGPDGFVYASDRNSIYRVNSGESEPWVITIDGRIGPEGLIPGGIAVTQSGQIVVPDTTNHRILELDADGDVTGEIRDDRTDRLIRPSGIDVAAGGTVVFESAGASVLTFDEHGTRTESRTWTVPGAGHDGMGNGDVLIVDDAVYVLDGASRALLHLTRDAASLLHVSASDWHQPASLSRDSSGTLYVFDRSPAIFMYGPDGEALGPWMPDDDVDLGDIILSMTIQNDLIYLSHMDSTAAGISVFDLEGAFVERVVEIVDPPAQQELVILSIAIAPGGDIFTANPFTRTLRWYSPAGTLMSEWPFGVGPARGSEYPYIAVSDTGTLYVADGDTRQILVYEPVQ